MTDLHETPPKYTAEIDKVGWVFAALVGVIAVVAGIVAYDGVVANGAASHVVASR